MMDRRGLLKALGIGAGLSAVSIGGVVTGLAKSSEDGHPPWSPLFGRHPIDVAEVDGWHVDIFLNSTMNSKFPHGTIGWKARCSGCGVYLGAFFEWDKPIIPDYNNFRSAIVHQVRISRPAHMKETGCGG